MKETDRGSLVTLDPATEIVFKGPYTDIVRSYLKIQNLQNRTICFKVKTTVPKIYCVRPNRGVLKPGESANAAVTLEPSDTIPTDTSEHKFMVQSCYAPAEAINIESFWKTFSPAERHCAKLRVVFESGIGSNSVSPSVSKSIDDLQNTIFKLTQEKDRIQNLNEKLTNNNSSKNTLIEARDEQIEELQKTVEQNLAMLTELRKINSLLSQDKAKMAAEIERITMQAKRCEKNNSELTNNISAQKASIGNKDDQIRELDKKLKNIESAKKTLTKNKDEQIQELQKKAEKLNNTIAGLRNENSKLTQTMTRVQQMEELRKAEMGDTITELRGTISQLTQEKTAIHAVIEDQRIIYAGIVEEKDRLEKANGDLKKRENNHNAEKNILELNNSKLRETIDELKAESDMMQKIKDENEQMKQLILDEQKRTYEENEKNVQMTFKLQEQINELTREKEQLVQSSNDIIERQRNYAALTTEKEELERLIDELQGSEALHNAEKENMELNNAKLREKVSELKLKMDEMQKLQSENDQLKTIVELQKKNSELIEKDNKSEQLKNQENIELICELRERISLLEGLQQIHVVPVVDVETETICGSDSTFTKGIRNVLADLENDRHSELAHEEGRDYDDLPTPPSELTDGASTDSRERRAATPTTNEPAALGESLFTAKVSVSLDPPTCPPPPPPPPRE